MNKLKLKLKFFNPKRKSMVLVQGYKVQVQVIKNFLYKNYKIIKSLDRLVAHMSAFF